MRHPGWLRDGSFVELVVEPSGVIVVSMATKSADSRTQRGEIETLPSGALRVRVYSGLDPLTGKRVYLTETVPAGPKAVKQAEKIRTRFLAQVDDRRSTRTKATVDQLLDRHFDELDVEEQTKNDYRSLAANHIRPLIGSKPLAKVTGELQDSFYRELRRCRDHCDGKRSKKCRTTRPHECDHRCREHTCSGLADASIRKIQSILKGAGKRAFRWEWVGSNPFDKAEVTTRAEAQPSSAYPDAGCRDSDGVVVRPRLGNVHLDQDHCGLPARRDVRLPLARLRPRFQIVARKAQHPSARVADLGEGRQDSPRAQTVAG